MREAVLEGRSRWMIASGGAVVILLGLLFLFRFPAPTVTYSRPLVESKPAATVQLAQPGERGVLVQAEAELRDLRPLFLPTERNAALPEPTLEPGRTYLQAESLKPSFSDAEAQISNRLPAVATLGNGAISKAAPADALGLNETPLALDGFGRAPNSVTEFMARGGYVEVTAMKDGQQVFGDRLPIEARPPTDKSWAPVELLAAVDPAGLVSPLVVTDGSGVEEVDAHFRTYLAQIFRIGERLSPGFYRITVAP